MNRGAIFTATRHSRYIKYAFIAAKSLKEASSVSSVLITTLKKQYKRLVAIIGEEPFEDVISTNDNGPRSRLRSLTMTPYDKTLAMDCDVLVLEDIGDLFTLLDKYDLCLCHSQNRQRAAELYDSYKLKLSIPYGFCSFQGGLLLYNKNNDVMEFCRAWYRQYKRLWKEKQIPKDEISLRQMLWVHNLKLYILPPEYNINKIKWFKFWECAEAIPKILHYTQDSTFFDNRAIIDPIVGREMSLYINRIARVKL